MPRSPFFLLSMVFREKFNRIGRRLINLGFFLMFFLGCTSPKIDDGVIIGNKSDEGIDNGPGFKNHISQDVNISWNEWNANILGKAVKQDKPLLLYFAVSGADGIFSIENASVRYLVENKFTSVRVNPFHRPDLARRYAPVGWPALSLLLNGGEHVALATDLPAHNARTWLMRMADHYDKRRHVLAERATSKKPLGSPIPLEVASVYKVVLAEADMIYGGFGRTEKFPELVVLHFLLQYNRIFQDKQALEMWKSAVDALLQSPIWDAEIGGIHTFSYTADWTMPSGAKDAADQAGILELLLMAHEIDTKRFAPRLNKQLNYIKRHLFDSEQNLFYGRQVLISNHESGWWTDRTAYADRNARLVVALLRAAEVLGQSQWAKMALCVAETLSAEFIYSNGCVRHCLGEANSCTSGLLIDQLLVSRALWLMHEWSGDERFMEASEKTLNWTERNLYDSHSGAFRDAMPIEEFAWPEHFPFRDNIHPAGNAVAIELYLDRNRPKRVTQLATSIFTRGKVSRAHAGMAAALMRYQQRVGSSL